MRSSILALVVAFLALAAGGVPAAGQQAAESFAGIDLVATPRPLVIAADERTGLASTGSIEFGITIPDTTAKAMPTVMVLLSQENGAAFRFRIAITNGGTRLGLYGPDGLAEMAYDFRSAAFYQIGLSTVGNLTKVFINGDLEGEIRAGYGPPAGDMSLFLGGQADGAGVFAGEIDYFRIWDRALTLGEYSRVFAEFGLPAAEADLMPDLRLYSMFTDRQKGLFFATEPTADDILADQPIGAGRGKPFVDVIPPGTRLHGFVVSGTARVESFQILVKDGSDTVIPLPVRGTVADGVQPSSFILPDEDTIAGISAITTPVLETVRNQDGSTLTTARQVLRNIGFRSSSGATSATFGDPAPFRPAGNETIVEQRFSDGFRLGAFFGVVGNGIESIGTAPAVSPPVRNAAGRWLESTVPEHAEKLPDETVSAQGSTLPHGNYKDRMPTMVVSSNRGLTLQLFKERTFYQRLRMQYDGTYTNGIATLSFEDENSMILDGVRFERVRPYEPLPNTSEFIPLGGTFTLDSQLPFYRFSFYGYDITKMNPLNLQNADGQTKPVFRQPAVGSREYYPVEPKLVPHGMLFASDVMDVSTTKTIAIRSSAEHAQTVSDKLGLSIGIPKVFSFGVDSEVSKTSKDVSSKEQQLVLTEEVQTLHALVLDRGRVELDPAFRQAVIKLYLKRKAGQTIDYRRELIAEYGTHYANAITLGTVANNRLRYSKSAFGQLAQAKKSIDLNASATIRGVKVGGKYGHSSELSNETNSELEEQFEEFKRIGRDDKPVPVYMDVRTLDDLFSPLFFDEPDIYGLMRLELAWAIGNYVAERAPKFNSIEDTWEPYLFSADMRSMVLQRTNATGEDAIFGEAGFNYAMKGRDKVLRNQWSDSDPVLFYEDNPFSSYNKGPTVTVPLNTTPQFMVMTGREICAGFATALMFGGEFHRQFQGVFSNFTEDSTSGGGLIYPRDLTPQDRDYSTSFKLRPGPRPLTFTVNASARRLAEPDGRFKPMPTCP